MIQTKQCFTCGKTISKIPKQTYKEWNNQKYCSRKCTYKGLSIRYKKNPNSGCFKKGCKTWNKGKENYWCQKEKHWNWNKGSSKIRRYIEIHLPNHPYSNKWGYIAEHRLVMEKKLGRYLLPQEVVHHINRQKKDNRIENLMLFATNGKHTKFHYDNKILIGS